MNNHNLRVYDSVMGLLSSEDNPTPLVRINRVLGFEHTEVYAKLEWYNPFGAVKDRVASNLIRDAEERGELGEVTKLVEATSGNTGMGLAMIANAKGYSLTTPMSNKIPIEKRTVLRVFGSEVIELNDNLCPAPGAPEGAIALADELSSHDDTHMLNQYKNEANPGAHYRTTGPEIWRQTQGKITHFVAGLGTCGTITGTGRFLKEKNPAIKVLGVHPEEGHAIPGVRSLKQLRHTQLYRPQEYDGSVAVSNADSFELCRRLNAEESLTAGPSSGMALLGVIEQVPDEPGNLVVVVFPDSVFKYGTSLRQHLPGLGGAEVEPSPGAPDPFLETLLANAEASRDLIEVSELQALLAAGPVSFIDVSAPAAFQTAHIAGSKNLAIDALSPDCHTLPTDLHAPVVTICPHGGISLRAMLVLKSLGYTQAKNLKGGLDAWITAGLPTE